MQWTDLKLGAIETRVNCQPELSRFFCEWATALNGEMSVQTQMLVGLSARLLDAIYNKNQQQLQTDTLRLHQSNS